MRIDDVKVGEDYAYRGRRFHVESIVKQAAGHYDRRQVRTPHGYYCTEDGAPLAWDEVDEVLVPTTDLAEAYRVGAPARDIGGPWADFVAHRDAEKAHMAPYNKAKDALLDALVSAGVVPTEVRTDGYGSRMRGITIRLDLSQADNLLGLIERTAI